MLINASNISVIRGGKAIVDGVSLALDAGDFITIIGPNGAGKSTLLKTLAGIIPPDSGRIERAAGVQIGYIPQRIAPSQIPMTAKRFLGLGNGKMPKNITQIVAEVGIASSLNTPIERLSGGEWQRLLLAHALIGTPDVIILDEPAQNLDIAGQLAFYGVLERIHLEQNIAIIMVSHDLHMVMASTRHVICLYRHICCSGAPQIVSQDPEFIRLFGADMARMMALYSHSHGLNGIHDHTHGVSGDRGHTDA